MHGKIELLAYVNGALAKRYPTADVFECMAKALAGVREVKRIE
jgi:hypothetical protein